MAFKKNTWLYRCDDNELSTVNIQNSYNACLIVAATDFGRDAVPCSGRVIIFSASSTTYCVIYLQRHRTALGGHNNIIYCYACVWYYFVRSAHARRFLKRHENFCLKYVSVSTLTLYSCNRAPYTSNIIITIYCNFQRFYKYWCLLSACRDESAVNY